MSKKLICSFSFVLMLGFVGNAAEIFWSDGDANHNHLWTDPDNWLGGVVPGPGDEAQILSPEADAGHGPIIRDGMDIRILGLKNEMPGRPGKPELTMTGGNLELTDFVWWGDYDNIEAYWYHRGGTVTVANEFELGWGPGTGGAGTLDMTGGTISAGNLVVPTSSGLYGHFYLRGGTFNVRNPGGLRINANGLIDISKGVLVLEGDETARVNDFIAAGQITAYGGLGTVLVTYGGLTTRVTALGSPKATNPKPADEATDVLRDVILGWDPGIYVPPTNGHKVYFSDNLDDVNNRIGGVAQDANSYTPPQLLDFGTTYYWRVDEVNGPPDYTVYQGDVWSFTTEPFAYAIENVTATASSQAPNRGPENTVNGSGLDDSGLLHGKEGDDNMWTSDIAGPQPTWIEFEFDKVYKLYKMWVWNANDSLELMIGFGFKDVTIEYSVNGIDYTTLGATHQFARGPAAPDYAHNTTIDFGSVLAKYVRLTANSNWGGILNQYGLSEVRFFYIPIRAREPYPDSGATDVDVDVVLSFRAGREAAQHDVYLSTDEQAVIDGTAVVTTITETSYAPPSLNLSETYYWKINEVNMAETPTMLDGDLWNFTTSEFIVVDDFELYNDLDPDKSESNRIFNTWIDGYEQPNNGSVVGYANPPFAEQAIIHSGNQSMPLAYDNTGGATYSEAERTFAAGQNWTKAGATTFVLYFHGAEGNTGQLYIKVDGSKVVYDGDPGDIAKPRWNQWNIDLASLGASLQNVTKLGIGIDGNGAGGTLYIDDVRLYVTAPEPQAN